MGTLIFAPSATGLGLNDFGPGVRVYALMARILLMATAVSLLSMPLTQHVWTWDGFLHGGHDFEFGALTILMTLSLVMVLAQLCKHILSLLLSLFGLLDLSTTSPAASGRENHALESGLDNPPNQSVSLSSFPLRI